MNSLVVFALLLVVVSCAPDDSQKQWENHKNMHGKNYSPEEDKMRKALFDQASKIISDNQRDFASGKVKHQLAHNEMSDMTEEELYRTKTGFKIPDKHPLSTRVFEADSRQTLPASIDWTTLGAVTPVKNQGQCGSCWTFSTAGAVEGQIFRKYNRLVSLSTQQLVDCMGSNGCNGGNMNNAFTYIKNNPGIDSDTQYPYVSGGTQAWQQPCKFVKPVSANVTGYVSVAATEAALQAAVANVGPISVGIGVLMPTFGYYSSGILPTSYCNASINHAVLVVGYGTNATLGGAYWKVKNSWSSSWGMGGYVLIPRGIGACGINLWATYPTV